jgi:hypothetical protein
LITSIGSKRFPLRVGQPIEVIKHRPTKLMKAAVGKLHLRFHTDGTRDVPGGRSVGQVLQQRSLADPCVAA